MSAKKQKTVELPKLPKISDALDGPLVQTLATVCNKLYDPALFAVFKPKDGEPDDQLDQDYEMVTKSGAYKEGGVYSADDSSYTGGDGPLVSGYHVFNKDTTQVVEGKTCGSQSLAEYGKVIDGFTDFHGEFQCVTPPFAALVVQPKDMNEAPILILAWRGSHTTLDWVNDFAFTPTLSSRWSGETTEINAHGAFVNLVENTFSRHEAAIVALALKHKVERAFITGHSLGGGIANVAHLFVKAGAKKAGSPWAELAGEVKWLACTFASPVSIVRLYGSDKIPPLIVDLDASSHNVVYECDAVPRLSYLKFLGALLEIAAPEVLKTMVEGNPSTFDPWNAEGKAKWFGAEKIINVVLKQGAGIDDGVEGASVAAVKFVKNTGLAEVMRQYTHIGTTVFIKDKDLKYVLLTGAEIKETLNVGGNEFKTLLGGKPAEYYSNLSQAHTKAYSTLMFGAK